MFFLKFGISLCVLNIAVLFNASEALLQEKAMEVGEELKYELSYGFIKLGYVKYNVTSVRKEGKKTIYNAKLEIRSYPEVPFIKINKILESEMEYFDNELFSEKYYETSFKERSISRTDYKFNYPKSTVKVLKETDGNIERDQRMAIKKDVKYRDEITWQYEYRINSFSSKNYNVPVFANEEESSVRYSFNSNKTVVKIEKFSYDISVIKMEGISDYSGMFGFKGEFLVLLSDDDYRVPIKAYYNSSLGNVVCELISFKKNKWQPPAFEN